MPRVHLKWGSGRNNTSRYGEWYGNKTMAGQQVHAQIVMNNGVYTWEAAAGLAKIGNGSDSGKSASLAAVKESVEIAVTDWVDSERGKHWLMRWPS